MKSGTTSLLRKVLPLACWLCLLTAACESDSNDKSRSARQTASAAPNVVFIVIDTLRADSLGAYGNTKGNSPTVDGIAAEGTTFERAIAQAPWTHPSVASLFCSFYPSVHGVIDFRSAILSVHQGERKVVFFDESFQTLAESFSNGGYETAGFSANPFIVSEFGFAQGFDHYDSTFARNDTPGSVVNEAALAWISQRTSDKPFFAYLHYMDVHGPYNAAPRFLDPLLDVVDRKQGKRRLSKTDGKIPEYLRRLPRQFTDKKRHQRLAAYQDYWEARYLAGFER